MVEIWRIKTGVDSGAAVSVCPRDLCKDNTTKNTVSGTKCASAGKDRQASCRTEGNRPHEKGGRHLARREDAGDERAETFS